MNFLKTLPLTATLVLGTVLSGFAQGPASVSTFSVVEDHGTDMIDLFTAVPTIKVPVFSKSGAVPFTFEMDYSQYCTIAGNPLTWYCFGNIESSYGANGTTGFLIGPSQLFQASISANITNCGLNGDFSIISISVGTADLESRLTGAGPVGPSGCYGYPQTTSGSTGDNSGYSVTVTYVSKGHYNVTIYDRSGFQVSGTYVGSCPSGTNCYAAYAGNTSEKDPFNNAAIYDGLSTYTDSFGIANSMIIGKSNGYLSPFSWLDAGGNTQSLNITTSGSDSFSTGFPSCAQNNNAGTIHASDIFSYPDGSNITFTAEVGAGGSGTTTGRIGSFTTRQGGTISYTYGTPSGCSGYFNGGYLSRTDADGTRTYTLGSKGLTGPLTTTVLDPGSNKTVYYWDNSGGLDDFITQIIVYQNTGTVRSPSYTQLKKSIICYNGQTPVSSCINSTSIHYPITEKDTYTYLGTMSNASRVQEVYDSYGNTTSVASYDFGAGSPTFTTVTTFSGCGQGSTIHDHPCSLIKYNGTSSGTKIAQTTYTYNSAGGMLTQNDWTGSTTLTTTNTIQSNGTVASSTAPDGLVTSFLYNGSNGCNTLLATSLTKGSLPAATIGHNCYVAKTTQTTDSNGSNATATYSDPLLRITSVTNVLGLSTTTSHPSATETLVTATFAPNAGGSATEQTTTWLDSIGRLSSIQTKHGSSTFDTNQRLRAFSGTNWIVKSQEPCIVPSNNGCPTTGTTTTLDPLGRTMTVVNANGDTSTTTLTYGTSVFDISVTQSPAPAGENNKTTQTEFDGVGRIKSVCVLSGGGTSCGQAAGGSGMLYSYSYSYATGQVTTTITHGSESKSSTVDALGRTISQTTPEAGTVQYSYDSNSFSGCSTTGPMLGHLVQKKTNSGNVICYWYNNDAENKFSGTTNSVSSTTNPSTCIRRGSAAACHTAPTGYVANNTQGRVFEAETHYGSTLTDEWFSYDAAGNITDEWQYSPNSGGYYHTKVSYNLNSTPATEHFYLPGSSTDQANFVFYLDGDGVENYAATLGAGGGGGSYLTTGMTRDAWSHPLTITLENAIDNDTYTYDPATGRMLTWSFTTNQNSGLVSNIGSLTWNHTNSLGQLSITDGLNAGGTQACSYGHDDVNRLSSVSCTPSGQWSQTFSYDQYNNLNKSGSLIWNAGYNTKNQYTGIGATYDSDGQITYDSFDSYTWNVYHKVATFIHGTTSVICGTQGVCYTYDAMNRVVDMQYGTTTYQKVYGPLGIVASFQSGSSMQWEYVQTPGGGTVIFIPGNPEGIWYQHKDWLGSSRLESWAGAPTSVAYDLAYAPFGEVYDLFGSAPNRNFTGDTEDLTGSAYMIYDTPNRELHTSQGRWLSPDPAGDGWNAYAYATMPDVQTDPSGLWLYGGGFYSNGGGHDDYGAYDFRVYRGDRYNEDPDIRADEVGTVKTTIWVQSDDGTWWFSTDGGQTWDASIYGWPGMVGGTFSGMVSSMFQNTDGDASASVQVAIVEVDAKGNVFLDANPGAGVNVSVTLNGPTSDQKVLANVSAGDVTSAGTSIVKNPDGTITTQGTTFTTTYGQNALGPWQVQIPLSFNYSQAHPAAPTPWVGLTSYGGFYNLNEGGCFCTP